MQRKIYLFYGLFLLVVGLPAQNTVGVLMQQEGQAYEGYNLLFPNSVSDVYLIDNCGQIVHTWEDGAQFRPGNAVYLLDNGDLIKCKRAATSGPNNPIWAGGAGETVEIRTWDNELLYDYTLNNEQFRLHHDVEPLPNGNILLLAWERKTREEAIAMGRNPDLLAQDYMLSEAILEWNPELDEIVWEWHVWDHLIQNHDNSKPNFGNSDQHPERINLNYDEHEGSPDWLHINSIAYNPVLDQIVLSVPYFNEFWVIDHALTTQEAAEESGDLRYRWGNPAAYNNGTLDDKRLYFQHDARWINPNAQVGEGDFGKISVYNNRVPTGATINIVSTTLDGTYTIGENAPEQSIQHPENPPQASSRSVSSAQFLPNGNILTMAGRWGFAYEMNPANEVVWEYRVPISLGRVLSQGETPNIGDNLTFRMTRYGLDYPAFENKDLTPKAYWELNPNEGFCGIVDVEEANEAANFTLYPNPVQGDVQLTLVKNSLIRIHTATGKAIQSLSLPPGKHTIDTSTWEAGLYFLGTADGEVRKLLVF